MEIIRQNLEDGTLLKVNGRIDTTNYTVFENAVNNLFEEGASKIYIDCGGLSYISSSGLRIFLIIQKKMMAEKGKLKIFGLQPGIQEIFDISGFSSVFSIFSDLDSALKSE